MVFVFTLNFEVEKYILIYLVETALSFNLINSKYNICFQKENRNFHLKNKKNLRFLFSISFFFNRMCCHHSKSLYVFKFLVKMAYDILFWFGCKF
jgi:hypothetical protein